MNPKAASDGIRYTIHKPREPRTGSQLYKRIAKIKVLNNAPYVSP